MSFPWNDQSIPALFITPDQIVVASDLTDIGRLLPHVAAQARARQAAVTLVHAIPSSPIARPQQILDGEIYARQFLGQMKRALEREGVRCSLVVGRGTAADVVEKEITRNGAGRLIIGTHRHGPCGQNMIGTVANSLLLNATVPVFVVPPGMQEPSGHAWPRRILHPVVPSGSYRESMCFAAEIAHRCKAELTLLHVMPPASATGPYANLLGTRTRQAIEEFIWPPDVHVRTHLEYGDPVQTILRYSENADWIVMAISHDFPWWSKQNSHTYSVIAESRCPVLTFHDRILPAQAETELSELSCSA